MCWSLFAVWLASWDAFRWLFWLISRNRYLHMNADQFRKANKKSESLDDSQWGQRSHFGECLPPFLRSTRAGYLNATITHGCKGGIQSRQLLVHFSVQHADKRTVCVDTGRVLTQDSVEGVPHVDSVELGGREGTAHRSVSCQITCDVRNRGFVVFYIFCHLRKTTTTHK